MIKFLKKEIYSLDQEFRSLDKKTVIILLSAIIFLTISRYFASRTFFILNLNTHFSDSEFSELIQFVYWFSADFICLFLLPVLIILLLLKEKPGGGYGFSKGDFSAGMKFYLISLILMIPLVWFATSGESFLEFYPLMYSARTSWELFLLYETGLLLYIFSWEFIWRGYIQFGTRHTFGNYAIFIQTIPFVILHYGKPVTETFGAVLGGLALGIIAFRTGSFLYGVMIHYSVMFSIDLISVMRYRTGSYGAGFQSLLKIFNNL